MQYLITYAPAEAEPRQWEFDPDTIGNVEAETIESVGGDLWETYDEWLGMVGRGNVRSHRALIWILLQRSNPKISFDEVTFRRNEVSAQELEEPQESGKGEDGTDTDSQPPDSA